MYQKNPLFLRTIGIAGHIDHGKTTLTQRLTGVDTDRLKVEKNRGISIELGFAPYIFPSGEVIGIVDVPGHERFIRQMVAGVAGIDFVLLVIAADEGIMPQTREHTDILQYLGIGKGIIVLTKTDLVDEEWMSMIKEEVTEWAKDTFLAGAEMVAVSGKTGKGIELLRKTIEKELVALPLRRYDLPARIPIDRVFNIKGIGTVVTGTMYEGRIAEGDLLELLPQREKIRVRGLQVHNHQVEEVFAGERVAINITGGNVGHVTRGMVLVAPDSYKASDRIDIGLSTLKNISFSLKQRTRVRLHIGTSEVIGRLIFFDRNIMEPGEEIVCQLQLEEAIVSKKGDPFIIRRLSPATTIGGGRVIDPYAKPHRFGEETVKRLELMMEGSLQEQLIQYLEQKNFVTLGEVKKKFVISKEELQVVLHEADHEFIVIGRETDRDKESYFLVLSSQMERWSQQIIDQLVNYHEKYPLRQGLDKALLKSYLFKKTPDKLWREILDYSLKRGKVQEVNNLIYLKGFAPDFPNKYRHRIDQALTYLREKGLTPPLWEMLMQEYAIPDELGNDLKAFLINKGDVIQVAENLLIDREKWVKAAEKLREQSSRLKALTPTRSKEILGIPRKYLILFLESLDHEKWTKRTEEGRVWL